MNKKPNTPLSLRHIALYAKNLDACEKFYVDLLGMKIVWRPDADNIYLSNGDDNLALHRAPEDFIASKHQHLDHMGFFLKERHEVDEWHDYLKTNDVTIKFPLKDHRDNTRSFYCADPEGNIIQFIYYPL